MLVPLVVLALLSLWRRIHPHSRIPGQILPTLEGPENFTLVAISVAFGLVGIAVAYVMYVAKPGMADSFADSLGGLYTRRLQQVVRG